MGHDALIPLLRFEPPPRGVLCRAGAFGCTSMSVVPSAASSKRTCMPTGTDESASTCSLESTAVGAVDIAAVCDCDLEL